MSLPVANFPPKTKQYSSLSTKTMAKPIMPESIYWRDYYEQSDTVYEWNNGYLEEKPVSDHETCLVYNWFINLLFLFLDTHPIATFSNLDMGFRLVLPGKVTVRKPDLGVVLNNNPVPLLDSDMTYRGIFDLCVEALSNSNKKQKERDTVTKKAEYAAVGVTEYFIIHATEEPEFYRLGANGTYVPIGPDQDAVICSKVLPGFQFRIKDLSDRPSEKEMLEDLVYQCFVLPDWQMDRKLRRASEQRAQTEISWRLEAEQHAKTETSLRLEAEQRAEIEASLRLEVEQRAQAEAAIAKAEITRLKMLLSA
ncbi:Uma2 domain-containing protein [Gammaproteobacteria bacterium]